MAKISKEAANEIMQWKINSPNVSVETLRELNGLLISMTEPEPEPERQKLKQAAVLPAPKIEVGQWMKFIDRNVIKKCVRIEWNNALASPSRTINLHWKGEWRYYIDEFEYWVDSEIIPVVSLQLPDEPIRVGSWVITEDGITGLLIGINPDVHRKYIVSCDHKGNCTNDWRVTTAARVREWLVEMV